VAGLVSDLERKNAEGIAYLHDPERQGLQKFLGQAPWDDRPLLTELAHQVGAALGEADGLLVFDPSAFPKKGNASVGVQRQLCGRLGKIDNCQVCVYLAYVGRSEHALVEVRLYLPQEWARDRQRRRRAGVPRTVCFRTRHELILEMLDERGPLLPHAWVSGDDELGRCSWFRQELRSRQACYLLAVPSNTAVRDLAAGEGDHCSDGHAFPVHVGVAPGRLCVLLTRLRQACLVVGRDGDELPEDQPPKPAYLGWGARLGAGRLGDSLPGMPCVCLLRVAL
jgi:SRSO17 transposase